MAGIGEFAAGQHGAGRGAFSRLARSQYAALAAMRWQGFRNGLRSSRGVFELGARAFAYLTYGVMGVGIGAGAGVAAYIATFNRQWIFMPILFWSVFLLWQTVPIALASFQEQYDMTGLLRYPLSFGTYFLLFLVFGLVDISTLLGGLCSLGILVGITMARPNLFVWAVAVLAGFAAFNVLLVRLMLVWLDRWLAKRRTREILSALFVIFLLGLQLLNPAVYEGRTHRGQKNTGSAYSQMGGVRKTAMVAGYLAQEWLPPGLAAEQMRRVVRGEMPRAAGSLGALALYVLAACGLLAVRLRAEYRGENLSETAAARNREERRRGWLLDGTGPVAAVMEKELRTFIRSMPLLYSVGAPLFVVLVFGSVLRGGGGHGGQPFAMALPLCVGYALLGSSQIIYNTLGVEGTGIQVLFLSPTPMRTVLLAKNLFHSLLFGAVALMAGLLASIRLGIPRMDVIAATLAWIVFALPANLTTGNLFSLMMPHRMNLGRLTRRKGSAASALLSMLVQFVLLGIGAGIFAGCYFLDAMWWAVPIFLVLAAVAFYGWRMVLRDSDAIAARRKDVIIAALVRAE
ncbi:MAG TPA: hypothetical protein VFI20_13210 [Terracidiphilus sp.]|nr:hypothetical protein [Terracidiphilus sp.]